MDGLVFLLIIGAVLLYRMGPRKRSTLKRQINKALGGSSSGSPSRRGARRRSSLPPPSDPQPPPPHPPGSAPEPIEIVEPIVAPGPMEPVVIDLPEPEAEPVAEPPTSWPMPPPEPTAAAAPDLRLAATIEALFLDRHKAHDRQDTFESAYAGRQVEWTAEVVRASNSRRHGEAARRVEFFLGYASDNEFHSDRVVAEAYFPPDTGLERDATVTFRATLADANVLARRVVLDDAHLV